MAPFTRSRVIDKGRGATIVLIPGIQGRYEWMMPAIDALARTHRVLSFSLSEVSGDHIFDRWSDHIRTMLVRADAETASVVGVSFGGLVATHFAARHHDLVERLILVSAPSPRWRPDPHILRYLAYPRLALPLFAWGSLGALLPEVAAAFPTRRHRARFAVRHAARVLRHPVSPRRMAEWVRAWMTTDIERGCAQISRPTLVITGESHLDRIVPVESTLDYLRLIPHAEHVPFPQTGHIGLMMHPAAFATTVCDFLQPATATAMNHERLHQCAS